MHKYSDAMFAKLIKQLAQPLTTAAAARQADKMWNAAQLEAGSAGK